MNAQLDVDGAEILRQHLWAGNVDVETAYGLASKMIEREWHEVRASVIAYMEQEPERTLSAIDRAHLWITAPARVTAWPSSCLDASR